MAASSSSGGDGGGTASMQQQQHHQTLSTTTTSPKLKRHGSLVLLRRLSTRRRSSVISSSGEADATVDPQIEIINKETQRLAVNAANIRKEEFRDTLPKSLIDVHDAKDVVAPYSSEEVRNIS